MVGFLIQAAAGGRAAAGGLGMDRSGCAWQAASRVLLVVWRSPGLRDAASEATVVVLGRKSRCHVHIRLSSVDELSSWPGSRKSRSLRSPGTSEFSTAVYAAR